MDDVIGVGSIAPELPAVRVSNGVDDRPMISLVQKRPWQRPEPSLFTAVIAHDSGGGTVQVFAALVARDRAELEFSLSCRFGSATASAAQIRRGFDHGHPLVEALVAPAMADMLALIAAKPDSPLAAGLDVVVEQRFFA